MALGVIPSLLVQIKVALFSLIIYLIINEYYRYTARIPHISGPPGLPLIGNLANIRVNAAEQYRKWSKEYGQVYQIMLGNIPVIVVNSAASAKALFIRNSHALSSRPEFYTFHKVCLSCHGTHLHRPTSNSFFLKSFSLTVPGQQSEHLLTAIP